MLNQISGSFNTAAAEIEAVKTYLNRMCVPYKKIEKYENRDEADIKVVLDDEFYDEECYAEEEKTILFEVKYEASNRWKRWGEYGFEGGAYNPRNGWSKPSKAEYSKAHFWLFYSTDHTGYIMMNCYWFIPEKFIEIQNKYGKFRETTSINYETGKADRWISSVYFVNPVYLEEFRVNDKYDIITAPAYDNNERR